MIRHVILQLVLPLLILSFIAMIEVEGLVKYFGNFKAVDDISLSVDQGTVLGFLGPNGAGKSTTMKLITGFLKPSKGKIKICNYNLETHPIEAKTRIGYLPEGAPTYQDMTPASYLNFIAQMYGYTGAQKRVANYLCCQ